MLKKYTYDNANMQRLKLLKFFIKESPTITVGEAIEKLGILSPPARILELRRDGYVIETVWLEHVDGLGIKHRIGMYVFQGRRKEDEVSNK